MLLKDREVFSSDFENSIIELEYVSKEFKRGYTLFIPEVLVDKIPATTGDGLPLSIGIGDLIQIPCPGPGHPVRYGTVKWIGLLPNVVGQLAGIELVKFVPLCVYSCVFMCVHVCACCVVCI